MWPPTKELHLERCIRCLPFLANTGGFFVALLRKCTPWPESDAESPLLTEKSSADSAFQFSPDIPQEVAKHLGIPPSLDGGSLMCRGARKFFYCTTPLVSVLQKRRRKPLSLISAGVCAFNFERSPAGGVWQLTPRGMDALKLNRPNKEANAVAAKKSLEGHTCSACGLHRHGVFFSRKMLTRPPSKRKCTDCVVQGSIQKDELPRFRVEWNLVEFARHSVTC